MITEETVRGILQGQNYHLNQVTGLSNEQEYKQLFMWCARQECKNFTVTDDNRKIILDVFKWCMMQDGIFNPDKGLFLYGTIGTGKSTLLRIVKRFCRYVRPLNEEGNPYSFAIFNAQAICKDYTANGYVGIEKYINSRRLAIDELGREAKETGYFGNTINVIREIMQMRYDRRDHQFTHVTTNMDLTDYSNAYGAHIYDRAKEMFNFVEMSGHTFRKK